MENTPVRIAADILNNAIASKAISLESSAPDSYVAAFNIIHAAVHEAAKKDYDANLFKAHS